MMNTLLSMARAKIATGWTQTVCARNADGKPVNPKSPEAVCWCAVGALVAAESTFGNIAFTGAVDALLNASPDVENDMPFPDIYAVNDFVIRSQAEAIAWFDRAIALGQ